MLLVVCQLSRDVIGYEDFNVIGAYRSVYCHSLTVVYCLVRQLVVCTVTVLNC